LYPDEDPIQMLLEALDLGDEVSGLDYVGIVNPRTLGVVPTALKAAATAKAKGATAEQVKAIVAPAVQLQRQAKAIQQAAKDRQIANAGTAQFLPTLPLPVFLRVLVAAPTQDIQPQANRHLRITKFKVSPDCAPNFRINRIEIAGVNVFGGGGPLDASLFAGDTESPPIQAVELPAGVPAIVSVTLKGGADADFSGVLYGIPLKSV
jgi:hypothetical protein